MTTNQTIIMHDGEPYVHMQTLMASIREQAIIMANSPTMSSLAPGMAVVLDYISREHDVAVLSDRQD